MNTSKADIIVYEKLSTAAPPKGVDVSRLPPPMIERQDQKLIYEFKDNVQNVWIVVIVHPDGFAEVSFDTMTLPREP